MYSDAPFVSQHVSPKVLDEHLNGVY